MSAMDTLFGVAAVIVAAGVCAFLVGCAIFWGKQR